MENIISAISPKAPAPNFSDEKKGEIKEDSKTTKPKRQYNMPNVGVVDAPNISKNPLSDTLRLKKQEMPKTAYLDNSSLKKKSGFSFYNITSALTVLFGTLALFSQGNKIKKFFKK